MPSTFFFYDLETSGLNGRDDRIMQFAGQRTDTDLQPIGEPVNVLVALNDDTLPSPGALMVTGITPQKTNEEGYSEADFCRIFVEDIATPDTTIVGYNNIRFDDEFMRAILWRNYHDPYKWAYADGRSRWDMLDVVRLTRALRPEGIEWPVVDGKPSNRLELLSKVNGVEHENAHDALSDVNALIAITQLIRDKQPQLFEYLFKLRDKNELKQLINLEDKKPFVYASGRYPSDYHKTTVAYPVAAAEHGNVFVYDLRQDPADWFSKSANELRDIMQTPYLERDEAYVPLPLKKLQYNRCPAVAPVGVLEQQDGWAKIGVERESVAVRAAQLDANPEFTKRLADVVSAKPDYPTVPGAENQLYDKFIEPRDALRAEAVRNATRSEIATLDPKFDDKRLAELYPRYKARNYPQSLSTEERAAYETYRIERLTRQSGPFMKQLQQLSSSQSLSSHQQFVLEELKLWFEAIMPTETGY